MPKSMLDLQNNGKQVTSLADDALLLAMTDPGGLPDDAVIEWGDAKGLLKTYFDTLYKPLSGSGDDGWISGTGTWSYSSADSPTFVISINADVTGLIGAGDRIKLTQTTTKYFIVTKVGSYSGGATLVTLFGGTDYTLANAAIANPFFSHVKAPFGFPLEPNKWTVSVTDSSVRLGTATKNTWWRPTGSTASLDIPIGSWYVSYRVVSRASVSGGTPSYVSTFTTLSTTTNSETDATTTSMDELAPGAAPVNTNNIHALGNKVIDLTSKTTYYLLHKMNTDGTASGATSGFNSAAVIAAVCAYL